MHYHIGAYMYCCQITFGDSKKLTCKQLSVKIQIQNIENMKPHKMCKWKIMKILKNYKTKNMMFWNLKSSKVIWNQT